MEVSEPPVKKQRTDSTEESGPDAMVTKVTSPVPSSPVATVAVSMPECPISLVDSSITETASVTDSSQQTVVKVTAGTTIPVSTQSLPRPVTPVTTGNIRPALQLFTVQNEIQQVIKTNTIQSTRCPTPTTLAGTQRATEGTVRLKIQPPFVRGPHPKSPSTLPAGVTIATTNSPRLQTPQVVTISNVINAPTSILSKPIGSKLTVTEVKGQQPIQILSQGDTGKSCDMLKLAGTTQISFQVPVNWSGQGTKSLLDNSSGKLSFVPITSPDSKSLLQDNKTKEVTTAAQTLVETPPPVTSPKTFVTGNKLFGTLQPSGVMGTTSTGLPYTRVSSIANPQSIPTKITKANPFVFSNKQYTFVPTSTQIVKTDTKLNKAKITMAEAQIMLPSGPAKISWPVQQPTNTSDSKQILITSPVMKTSAVPGSKTIPVVTQKPGTTVPLGSNPGTKITSLATLVPTAKVVEASAPSPTKMQALGNGVRNSASTKTTVLPAQKNWELVKQSPHLSQQSGSVAATAEGTTTIVTAVKAEPESNPSEALDKVENSDKNKTEVKVPQTVKAEPKVDGIEEVQDATDRKSPGSESVKSVSKDSEDLENVPEAMEVDENKSEANQQGEVKDERDSKEKAGAGGSDLPENKEDFNPVDAMNWKDGIGELPGSDLKFRMNDLGVLEVITDDLECNETLNTSNESDAMETDTGAIVKDIKKEPDAEGNIKKDLSDEVSNKDEIVQCENCGEYGFLTDFYKEGRFCSQTCVGAFDSKHMRGVKKHGTMSKVVLGLKKSRKKFLLKDGFHRDKDLKSESMTGKKSQEFFWSKYLEQEKGVEAPAKLFKNPFPSSKNGFRVSMKLEGIDPMHQSLFCALSVAEVCGYRIRLHFDGYSECFDFWMDADSPYIFPCGFCEKNGKILQPPKGFTVEEFTWTAYLKLTKAPPAPKSLFTNQPVQTVLPNLFRIGSKLEAVDKKNSSLICVASVADTLGDKILIHFDSWDNNYDYWCDTTAPFIHATGYCEENSFVLSPPIDWKDADGFTWEKYLTKTKSVAVPARAFKPRSPVAFTAGMKVEVVDKRNPLLVRVATICEVDSYMVKIHFDGWSDVYDYWLDDDSPDLHPPGWCAKTGHPLIPPISPSDLIVGTGPGVCPTPGCKGIGHIKGAKYSGHHSTYGCPYSELNMNKESVLGDRLGSSSLKSEEVFTTKHEENVVSETKRFPPDSSESTGKLMFKAAGPKLQNGDVQPPKKWGRGRRPKSYYIGLEEQKIAREQERLEREENIRQGIHNSVFSSAMITTPKNEVPLCWEQHSKLLPGVTNIRGNDVNKWTIDQVAAFVNTLPGCEEQAKIFKEEQIDGEAFLLLTQSDIVKIMNIKLGPALKIFNSIVMFKNSIEV